jgi:hypothetical protein
MLKDSIIRLLTFVLRWLKTDHNPKAMPDTEIGMNEIPFAPR